MWKKFLKNENGTVAIEYALIATLVGLVIIAGITGVGTSTTENYKNIDGNL